MEINMIYKNKARMITASPVAKPTGILTASKLGLAPAIYKRGVLQTKPSLVVQIVKKRA